MVERTNSEIELKQAFKNKGLFFTCQKLQSLKSLVGGAPLYSGAPVCDRSFRGSVVRAQD